jgi:two-component system, NarL family, sensor kinase
LRSLRQNRFSPVAVAVGLFAAAGVIALLAMSVVAVVLLQRIGEREAVNAAQRLAVVAGHGIVAPALDEQTLTGNRQALARLDRIVKARVLDQSLVRTKLWTPQGRIVYSDEPRLIGRRYPLDEEDQEALTSGRPSANLSDLEEAENQYERQFQKLLQVYVPIQGPRGEPLLFEAYLKYSSVTASGRRLWRSFLPALAVALVGLWLLQLPLAWRLAGRVRRGQEERERLLRQALDASDRERRRIASDLHDGIVQDFTGRALQLDAEARASDEPPARQALSGAATAMRSSVGQLRTLIAEIYPPTLHEQGLAAALESLAEPLRERGTVVELDVSEELQLPARTEQLLFRAAQEALRNVDKHAAAAHVRLSLARDGDGTALTVLDDGAGFDPGHAAEGHVGLTLLRDLAEEHGGTLTVESAPRRGTRVRLDLP